MCICQNLSQLQLSVSKFTLLSSSSWFSHKQMWFLTSHLQNLPSILICFSFALITILTYCGYLNMGFPPSYSLENCRYLDCKHCILKIFFLIWTIFKVFIEFVTILLLFSLLDFWLWGMWDLNSLSWCQTCTPCIGRQSPNHWTSREVSNNFLI